MLFPKKLFVTPPLLKSNGVINFANIILDATAQLLTLDIKCLRELKAKIYERH